MLGLGHSLVGGSALGGFENNYGLLFDGTNDYVLGGISGNSPANGTIKPLSCPNGLTVAVWCKLDIDGEDDPYQTIPAGQRRLVTSVANGGWSLHYGSRRFIFHMKLVDGDGNTATSKPETQQPFMKNLISGSGQPKQYLHKPDGWHFVVGTWDGDRVKQIYLDGGRDQAGSSTVIEDGVGDFGSQEESSLSKVTESAASGGAYTVKYDTSNDRDEIDVMIGAGGTINSSTNVTTATGEYWEGYIGDVGIWNRELTSDEIKALYNLHQPTDMSTMRPDDLMAYWKMEEGSGTTLVETTGNVGADGSIHGAAFNTLAPSTDVSGYPGYQ